MQHRIGRGGDTFCAHLAAVRAKQGQQLGRAVTYIFMGLALGLALFGPALPGLILRLHRQTPLLALAVRTLNQIFFWLRHPGP